MLEVQKYLETHSLEDLEKDYAIENRIDGHLICLNYNQIASDPKHEIVRECRGLILRRTTEPDRTMPGAWPIGPTKVLNYPLRRFANFEESWADQIDWESAVVQEKLDGSLVSLYWDDIAQQWNVATRSVPRANIPVNGHDFTFADLFWKEYKKHPEVYLDEVYCYFFELCSPYNRIVVHHDKTEIFLLGMRNLYTLWEVKAGDHALNSPFPSPKTYKLTELEDIIKFVNEQDPTKQEGVVVIDKHFNRVKIKSLSYVTLNKARDSLGNSKRNCLTLVLEGKVDDIIGKLPKEIEENILDLQFRFNKFIALQEELYRKCVRSIPDVNDRKAFARAVNSNENIWYPPMFGIFSKKASSIQDWIQKTKKNGDYTPSVLDSILEKI